MAVPAGFTVVTSVITLAMGAFGTYVAIKKQDWGGYRLRHFFGAYEAGLSSRHRQMRRRGVATLVYIIPPKLTGTVIISVPQAVLNPGRQPIEDISLVVKYPGRFAVSDKGLAAFADATSDEAKEYMSRRRCSVRNEGAQVMITAPLLRGRETMTIDDQMAVIPHRGLVDFRESHPTLADRLSAIPGLRDFAEIEIALFSKQTRARFRKVDLFVIEAARFEKETVKSINALEHVAEIREIIRGEVDLEPIASAIGDVAGGKLIPPGVYFRSPWRRDPLKINFAAVMAPGFSAVESKLNNAYVGDPDSGEFSCFSYRTTAVDYKTIPVDLSRDQVMSYLGLRPVRQGSVWNTIGRMSGKARRMLGGASLEP